KNEEEERLIRAHREAKNLSSRHPVADIDEFVTRTIARDLERGGLITEGNLDPRIRPKHQLADARMQAVGANHEVGLSRRSVIKANPHASSRLLDNRNRVTEDHFDLPIQRTVDRCRKVRAPQAEGAATRQAVQGTSHEAGARLALSIHEARLLHLVAQLSE